MKNIFYFFMDLNNRKKREGFSVFLTVMLLSIILSIIFGLSAMIVSQHKSERALSRNLVVYYAAEAGIEMALFSVYKTEGSISHIYQEALDNGAEYVVYIYCCSPGVGCDFEEGDCPVYDSGVQKEKEDCDARRFCLYSTASFYGVKKTFEVKIDQVDRWTSSGGQLLSCGDNFIDQRDGSTYKTVQIGTQCWMAENLKYLPSVVGPTIGSETDPYYYVYGYEGENVSGAKSTDYYKKYGALYNFPAASSSCPVGWHLPTDAEQHTLDLYLFNVDTAPFGCDPNRSQDNTPAEGCHPAGAKIKGNDIFYPDWWENDNSSNFTALPAGSVGNTFYGIGYNARFWSSSERDSNSAWVRHLIDGMSYYGPSGTFRHSYSKEGGFSVRCIKD